MKQQLEIIKKIDQIGMSQEYKIIDEIKNNLK